MLITPLQSLLRRRLLPDSRVMAATGRSRAQVWRWRSGKQFPERPAAEALIALYSGVGERLDFNGCYTPSVYVDDVAGTPTDSARE